MYKQLSYVAAIGMTMLAVSCIDNRYDISDGIDGTVNIGGDSLSLPLGQTEKFMLKDLLDLEGNEYLKTDADGNFYLESASEPFRTGFSIDPVNFEVSSPARLEVHFDNEFGDLGTIPDGIEFNHTVEGAESMDFPEIEIPDMVTELFSAECDAVGSVLIRIESDGLEKIHMNRMEVTLPEWIMISGTNVSGNKVIITDAEIYSSADFVEEFDVIGADFTEMSGEYGFDKESGMLRMGGEITYSGDITGNTSDINETSFDGFSIVIEANIEGRGQSAVELKSIDATIDYTSDEVYEKIALELPEELGGSNTVLDLESAHILLDISNNTPVSGIVSGNIATKTSDGNKLADIDFTLPELESFKDMKIAVSERGDDFSGYDGYGIDGFNDILYRLPDSVIFNAMFRCGNFRNNFELGTNMELELGYSLIAPLAFGEDIAFEYETVVEDLNSDLGGFEGIRELILRAELESTLPLGITLDATAIDTDGKDMEKVVITFNGGDEELNIAAPETGMISAPLELKISLSETSDIKTFDGIRIIASISGSNGKNLNENQYIHIRDLSIIVPGGYTTELF